MKKRKYCIFTPSRMKWFNKLFRRKGHKDSKVPIQETRAVEEHWATRNTSCVDIKAVVVSGVPYSVNNRVTVDDTDAVGNDDLDTNAQLVLQYRDVLEEPKDILKSELSIKLQDDALEKVKDHGSDKHVGANCFHCQSIGALIHRSTVSKLCNKDYISCSNYGRKQRDSSTLLAPVGGTVSHSMETCNHCFLLSAIETIPTVTAKSYMNHQCAHSQDSSNPNSVYLVGEKGISFPVKNLPDVLARIEERILSLDHKLTSLRQTIPSVSVKTEESENSGNPRDAVFNTGRHDAAAVLSNASDKSLSKDTFIDDTDDVNVNEILDTSDALSQEVNTGNQFDLSIDDTNIDNITLPKQLLHNDETDEDVESIEDTENGTSSGYPLDTLDRGTSSCDFGVDLVTDSDGFEEEYDVFSSRNENSCHGDGREFNASSFEVSVDGDKKVNIASVSADVCTIDNQVSGLDDSDHNGSDSVKKIEQKVKLNAGQSMPIGLVLPIAGVSTTDNTYTLDVKYTSDKSESEGSDSSQRTEHTLSNDVEETTVTDFGLVSHDKDVVKSVLISKKCAGDDLLVKDSDAKDTEDFVCSEKTEVGVKSSRNDIGVLFYKEKNVDILSKSDENNEPNDNSVTGTDALNDECINENGIVKNIQEIQSKSQIDDNEKNANNSDRKMLSKGAFSKDECATFCEFKAHEGANEVSLQKYVPSKIDSTELCKGTILVLLVAFLQVSSWFSTHGLSCGVTGLVTSGKNKKKKACIESTGIYHNMENKGNEEEKKECVGKEGTYVSKEADGWDSAICQGTGNTAAKHTCSDALEITAAPTVCHVKAAENPCPIFGNTVIVKKGEIEDTEESKPSIDKYETESRKEGIVIEDNENTNVRETPEDKQQFGRTFSIDLSSYGNVTDGTPTAKATLQYKKKKNQRRERCKKFLSESSHHVSAGNHRGEKRKTKTPMLNERAKQSKFKAHGIGVRNKRKVDEKEGTGLGQTLSQLYPKGTRMLESVKRKGRKTSSSLSRVEILNTKRSAPAPELAIENINEQLELYQQDSGYLSETIDSFITLLESVIKCSQSSSDVDYLKQSKYCKKLVDEEVNIQHRIDRLLSSLTYFRPYVASLEVAPGLKDYFQSLDNGQTPSLQEQMNIEWLRLRSLSSYQGNGSRLNLARNGFYHDSSQGGTSTRCVACNVEHSEWDYFSDIPGEHRRLSPNCPFVSDQAAHQDNVSIPSGASNAQPENAARDDATQSTETVAQTEEAQANPVDEGAGAYAQSQTVPPVVTKVSSAKPVSSASASSLDKRSSGALTSEHQSANVDDISMTLKRTDINSSVQITHESVTQSRQPTEDAENQSLPRSSIYLGSNRFTGSIPASALRAGSQTHGPTLDHGGSGSPAGNQAATTRANDVPPILSEAGLTQLASKLGEEWAILILCLQLPFEIMQEMMAEHGSTETALPTTIKACLARWRDTHTGSDQDKVDQLLNALNETGRTELVTFVRQYNQGSRGPATGSTHYGATGGSSRPTVTVQGSNDPRSVTVSNPKYPQYTSVDVRISSYRGWPTALDLLPKQMAEAGFFYAGVADFTRCFSCGGGLRNWESGDDPCMEHTRWFSNCEYMKKLKGEVYVNNVKQRQEDHLAAKRRQREEQERRNAARRNPELPVETDAGKTLLAMGYTAERITHVIETLRIQTGNVTVSAGQAIRYIIDEDENGTAPSSGTTDARRNVGAPQIGRPSTPRNDATVSSAAAGSTSTSQSSATPPPVSVVPSRPRGRTQVPPAHVVSQSMARSRTPTSSPSNTGSQSPARQDTSQGAATGKTAKKKKNKKKGKGDDSKESLSASGSTTEPAKLDPKSLIEENERLRDMQQCKVCMDKPVDTTLLPCGHLVLCSSCAPRVNLCPICRLRIQGTVRTYLS